MIKILKCHKGVGPKVRGEALVADDNFSARYDLDRVRGVFSRPQHRLYGQSYREVILVLNTAKGAGAIKDSFSLRHTALTNNIPYYTTVSGSRAAGQAIRAMQQGDIGVRTLQDFLTDIAS